MIPKLFDFAHPRDPLPCIPAPLTRGTATSLVLSGIDWLGSLAPNRNGSHTVSQERLAESESIDLLSPSEIVELIQRQDATIPSAVARASGQIAQAVEQIVERLRAGGKLHYVGAGTSGRIAMLDASEIPPTYGTDPGLVNVIMAGGAEAFFSAVEGAEDREEDAIRAVTEQVAADDALVGIAASGTTPFTLAAIRKANMLGALTIALVSRLRSPMAAEADIAIEVDTGPEVIMGSTRMKAGTAQKMILNTISTSVMVRLGRTWSNLMIDMPATNTKLQARAEKIVEIAAETSRARARQLLEEAGGDKRLAVLMGRTNLDRDAAEARLRQAGGDLREALRD